MAEKSIMINLGDERAKNIADVIGNRTCLRILDFLAEKDETVSEISNQLGMPINTVDYNIKKLIKAGLIEKSSHWWSVKGKKMSSYKVSNKKIVISPARSMAKVFAWVVWITGLTALTIRQFVGTSVVNSMTDDVLMVQRAGEGAIFGTEKMAESSGNFLSALGGIGPWGWFLIGAWFSVVLFFVITLINERRGK